MSPILDREWHSFDMYKRPYSQLTLEEKILVDKSVEEEWQDMQDIIKQGEKQWERNWKIKC